MKISKVNIFASVTLIAVYVVLGLIAARVLQLEISQRLSSDFILHSYQESEHLMHTSDDLTRMARSYVVTGNPAYKDHYYHILDMRNGLKPRPVSYPETFWYVNVNPKNQQLDPIETTPPKPWSEIMKEIGLSDKARTLLRLAKQRSDRLVRIEEEAFAAMQGLFDDGHGQFTKTGPVDQEFAIRILFDANYEQAKKEIMIPVQEFIELMEQSAIDETDAIHGEIIINVVIGITLIIFSILGAILLHKYIRKEIISPLCHLEKVARLIASDMPNKRAKVQTNNELSSLADSVNSMANSMQGKIDQFKILSNTDGLTGLKNRLFFDSEIEKEIERVHRYKTPVSLLMIDIDKFKPVNDTYGHLTGDRVLQKIAEILQDYTRNLDIACRYGGEELAVIMPETDRKEALVLAERIRQNIENENFQENGKGPKTVTVSIGVAGCPMEECTVQAFISAADTALYEAKESGRNKACQYQGTAN